MRCPPKFGPRLKIIDIIVLDEPDDVCCAECGEEEGVSLKTCKSCMLVKYCNPHVSTESTKSHVKCELKKYHGVPTTTTTPHQIEIVIATLNGIVGDFLHSQDNPFQFHMQCRGGP